LVHYDVYEFESEVFESDLGRRWHNYVMEKVAIQKKLSADNITKEKREILTKRLNDIEERLIPETLDAMGVKTERV